MMMSQFACPSSPDLFPRCGRVDQIPGQMRKPPKFIRIDEEQYTLQMWPAFRDRLLHILAHPTNLVGFTIEELVRLVYQNQRWLINVLQGGLPAVLPPLWAKNIR